MKHACSNFETEPIYDIDIGKVTANRKELGEKRLPHLQPTRNKAPNA